MHHKRVIRIVIHIHTPWPQTWLMLPSPLLPPCTAIIFRVRIVEVGGKAFDGIFEGGKEWCFGIAGERSVRVQRKARASQVTMRRA